MRLIAILALCISSLAQASTFRVVVAERLAWCEANPAEAARCYGVDVIERVTTRAGEYQSAFVNAPLHSWTEAIAREIVPEGWRWYVLTDGRGRPVFVLDFYRPPELGGA